MARELRTKVLDSGDRQLHLAVIPFGYDEGFDLLTELMQIATEGLGAVVSLGSILDTEMSELGPVLAKLPQMIQAKGGSKLVARLFGHTRCSMDGGKSFHDMSQSTSRDLIFAGEYADSFEAMGWVIEVNFGPFSGPTSKWKRFSNKLIGLLGTETKPRQADLIEKLEASIGNPEVASSRS